MNISGGMKVAFPALLLTVMTLAAGLPLEKHTTLVEASKTVDNTEEMVRATRTFWHKKNPPQGHTAAPERVIEKKDEPTPKKEISLMSRSGAEIMQDENFMVMQATSYCDYGQTKDGTYVHEGVIAVDPNIIPLGTKVYVEGYGYAVAHDTGGLIKGNIIDVWLPSEDQSLKWGRREVKVWILK